jgi:hypothetical protein
MKGRALMTHGLLKWFPIIFIGFLGYLGFLAICGVLVFLGYIGFLGLLGYLGFHFCRLCWPPEREIVFEIS